MPKQASSDERWRLEVEEAQTRLDAVLATMEPILPPQTDGPPEAHTPTGETYIVIKIGGSFTPAEVIDEWRAKLIEYLNLRRLGVHDVLWWRVRPEIDAEVTRGKRALLWHIYCRLALTHDAVVEA